MNDETAEVGKEKETDDELSIIQALPLGNNEEPARKEESSYYTERINNAEADKAEEQVRNLQQDREERQKYAKNLFHVICAWLIGIYSILLFNGFNDSTVHFKTDDIPLIKRVVILPKFQLSDTVLLALIGGTTVNVLGLFVIVANYLFHKPKPPKDKS